MRKFIKTIAVTILLAVTFTSCEKSEVAPTPMVDEEAVMVHIINTTSGGYIMHEVEFTLLVNEGLSTEKMITIDYYTLEDENPYLIGHISNGGVRLLFKLKGKESLKTLEIIDNYEIGKPNYKFRTITFGKPRELDGWPVGGETINFKKSEYTKHWKR